MQRTAAILGCAVAAAATTLQGQAPAVELLLARAANYVARFADEFTNVVAEERYRQEAASNRVGASSAGTTRELRSDFLMVKPAGGTEWIPFRDVFAVDGVPVRGREERLMALFVTPSPETLQQARAITEESSRYNLGNIRRSVNNPTIGLAFLQAQLQPRFTFTAGKRDADAGRDVWIVDGREAARPTLIKGAFDRDLPARGRFWIDAESGAVLRTELSFSDLSVAAWVTTEFQPATGFSVAVPVRMTESYVMSGLSSVTGRATYDRFRRFSATATETVALPRD